jgi:hypothetical protein
MDDTGTHVTTAPHPVNLRDVPLLFMVSILYGRKVSFLQHNVLRANLLRLRGFGHASSKINHDGQFGTTLAHDTVASRLTIRAAKFRVGN